jgi:hypothetical protein
MLLQLVVVLGEVSSSDRQAHSGPLWRSTRPGAAE